MRPIKTKATIEGRTYNTETATLLAEDHSWDGQDYKDDYISTFLFRTKSGRYFVQWRGKHETPSPGSGTPYPLDPKAAAEYYKCLRIRHAAFTRAFTHTPLEVA